MAVILQKMLIFLGIHAEGRRLDGPGHVIFRQTLCTPLIPDSPPGR